jgi:hypothetical protein
LSSFFAVPEEEEEEEEEEEGQLAVSRERLLRGLLLLSIETESIYDNSCMFTLGFGRCRQ